MPAKDNFSTLAFTAAEQTTIDTSITAIFGILAAKGEVLTPDEMKEFGKVAMERYGFVKMVADDVKKNPQLLSPRVKQSDYDVDTTAEAFMSSRVSQITNIDNLSRSLYVLVLYDMYVAANMCYRYVRLLAQEGDTVATTFYDKWKKQYETKTPTNPATPATPGV